MSAIVAAAAANEVMFVMTDETLVVENLFVGVVLIVPFLLAIFASRRDRTLRETF